MSTAAAFASAHSDSEYRAQCLLRSSHCDIDWLVGQAFVFLFLFLFSFFCVGGGWGGEGGVNRDLKSDPFLLLKFLVFVLVMIFQYKDIIIHAIQHKAGDIMQAEVIRISH